MVVFYKYSRYEKIQEVFKNSSSDTILKMHFQQNLPNPSFPGVWAPQTAPYQSIAHARPSPHCRRQSQKSVSASVNNLM